MSASRRFRNSFEAQIRRFSNTVNEKIQKVINQYRGIVLSWKLTGAGGCLDLVSEKTVKNEMTIKIRRWIS